MGRVNMREQRMQYLPETEGSSRVRIYGNELGTTFEICSLLNAIETNYITILGYQKLIDEIFVNNNVTLKSAMASNPSYLWLYQNKYNDAMHRFLEYENMFTINDIVSIDEYPKVIKASFNSPGFWEVVGSWNPFEQIRGYIKERHSRRKDKEYGWELERKLGEAEVENKRLSNDLLKLEISQKMINQLKEVGLSDMEIRHIVQKSYGNLELLNAHIDKKRITKIELVNNEDEEKRIYDIFEIN